jgi:hypothetical protein
LVGGSTWRLQHRRNIDTHVRACAGRARTPGRCACEAPRIYSVCRGGSGAPRPERSRPPALRHPQHACGIPLCQHPHPAGPSLGTSSHACNIHRAHLPPGPPDGCRAKELSRLSLLAGGASSGQSPGEGQRGPCNDRRELGGAHGAGRAAPPMSAASPRRLLHAREDGVNGSEMKGPGSPPRVRRTL